MVCAAEGAKNEPILSLDFHPRLPLLATAGMDNTVRLWRVREPHQVQAPTAADDGSRGAGTGAGAAPRATVTGAGVGGRPGDVGSAYVEFLYTLSQHAASVNVVRWSPAGACTRIVAAGAQGRAGQGRAEGTGTGL